MAERGLREETRFGLPRWSGKPLPQILVFPLASERGVSPNPPHYDGITHELSRERLQFLRGLGVGLR